MYITMILVLLGASILGTALMAWAMQKGRNYEADIAKLAARRNWTLNKVKSTSTKVGYLELSDAGAGWELLIYLGNRSGSSNTTLWRRADLGLSTGLAVYAPPLPEKTQMMFNLMMDNAGGIGRVLLDSLFKGLGPDARDLRAIDDDDPATLMTTPGAEDAFAPLLGAPELRNLNQFGDTPADVPYFVRDKTGLSLRINKRLGTASNIETYVDLAETLANRFAQ